MRLRQQTQGVKARRPSLMGVSIINSSCSTPTFMQGIQLRFHLLGVPNSTSRFPPDDARRPAARLTGKGGRLRFAADGHPLAVFQLNAPRFDLILPAPRLRRSSATIT